MKKKIMKSLRNILAQVGKNEALAMGFTLNK